ncbi:MAG: signal peptidase I [Spirochaetia bacterium]|nr:signal peptidase I [Spirochaetia bacterium]
MDFSGIYQIDHSKKKGKFIVFFRKYFLPFFLIFVAAFIIQLLLRNLLFFPVKLNTNSMEPSLKQGDRIFLIYPHMTTILKGDLIHVKHEGLQMLCKVVATEGDIAQILNKSLFINHALVKSYESISKDKSTFPDNISHRDNTGEFLIGPRQYFCLNDNWENTQDSRVFGAFSFNEISGKVVYGKYVGFTFHR